MSTPLVIPPALYWRWKCAAAEARALKAQQQLALAKADATFHEAVDAIARAVDGFDPHGTYQTDDVTCTVTPVEST